MSKAITIGDILVGEEPKKILEYAYEKASEEIEKDEGKSFLNELSIKQRSWITKIAEKSESQKAVTAVLTTSLVKKIEDSNQEVRYHQVSLDGGYSGRTFDTKYVTPFFREKFRRLAMRSGSGWLTRSLEQHQPFTLEYRGSIRNREVKESFLRILNDLEENKSDSCKYLIALFILIIKQTDVSKILQEELFEYDTSLHAINIDSIIDYLKLHFFGEYHASGASKLPVIAIYSVYQIIIKDIARYKGKKLRQLKSHLASDLRAGSIGDIEVVDEKRNFFEAVEIKHNIPIDSTIIEDAYEKLKNTSVKRYYLLTTAEPYIKEGEEYKVELLRQRINKEHGCEVIVNGIIPSLKYYLRLLRNPKEFVETYTKNLKMDFSEDTEVKREHIRKWQEIVELEIFRNYT